jgi:gag-polypeptide of LTR copia-type
MMIQKLNERYASSTLSTRMSLLNGLSYQKGKDMGEFVDSFASILDRLESMGAKIDEDLSVVMLLAPALLKLVNRTCTDE